MKNSKHILGIYCKLLPLIFVAAPGQFLLVCILGIIDSGMFVLESISMQKLVDAATNLVGHSSHILNVTLCIASFGLVKFIQQITNGFSNYFSEYWSNLANGLLQAKFNTKCSRINPLMYEDIEFINDLEKASAGMKNSVSMISVSIIMFTVTIPYIIFSGIFLYSIRPILVISLALIFIPVLVNHLFTSKLYSGNEDQIAPLRRELNYLEECVCDKAYIKESRILGAFSFFSRRHNEVLAKMNKHILRLQKSVSKRNALSKSVTLFGYLSVVFLLIVSILENEISLGSFSAVFCSLSTMIGLLEELINRHIGELTKNYGSIQNYLRFMDLPETDYACATPNGNGDIIIDHVSFRYPNAGDYALKNISLRIKQGETIAVVGTNGSGKTTLAKLLLGIYQPTSGSILFESDVGNIHESSHQASAIFQDYNLYPFSLEKNVRISDLKCACSNSNVIDALEYAGVDLSTEFFSEQLQTQLGKEFGGLDLSGGQNQRIAIARGYFRQHTVIILDEPTSAIDPLEEDRIYKTLQSISQNSTAIIITHRLGATRFADRIVVLNEGSINCIGTHEQLMKENGLYTKLFSSQARWYYRKN